MFITLLIAIHVVAGIDIGVATMVYNQVVKGKFHPHTHAWVKIAGALTAIMLALVFSYR